jgi:hypothetical protein
MKMHVYIFFWQQRNIEKKREKKKKQTRMTDKQIGRQNLAVFLSWIHMSAHTNIDTHSTSMPKVLCTFQTLFPSSESYCLLQPFVLAFMMGTHSRLGAGSPVWLLDDLMAASIAQSIIPDRW